MDDSRLIRCLDCGGDGIETCRNPDHGFLDAIHFTDQGRIGCPGCGHDTYFKIRNSACPTCDGSKKTSLDAAKKFCAENDIDFKERYEEIGADEFPR